MFTVLPKPRRREVFVIQARFAGWRNAIQRFEALGGEVELAAMEAFQAIGSHGCILTPRESETRPMSRSISTREMLKMFRHIHSRRRESFYFVGWWEMMAFAVNYFHRLDDLGEVIALDSRFQVSGHEPPCVPMIDGGQRKPLLKLAPHSRQWSQEANFLIQWREAVRV